MGKKSRDKGNAYERVIAHKLCSYFKLEYKNNPRTPLSGGMRWKGDIQKSKELRVLFPFHIECKNWLLDFKSFEGIVSQLENWYKQAKRDCPDEEQPIVIFHRDRVGDYVCFSDFVGIKRDEGIFSFLNEEGGDVLVVMKLERFLKQFFKIG